MTASACAKPWIPPATTIGVVKPAFRTEDRSAVSLFWSNRVLRIPAHAGAEPEPAASVEPPPPGCLELRPGLAEDLVGGRTGRTALAGEQLDHGARLAGGLSLAVAGAGCADAAPASPEDGPAELGLEFMPGQEAQVEGGRPRAAPGGGHGLQVGLVCLRFL